MMNFENEDYFKKAATLFLPSLYLSYRNYLQELYDFLKREIKGYTYFKYADDLGFGLSRIVSHYLKGRKNLSLKSAQKMIPRLFLNEKEILYLKNLISFENAKKESDRKKYFSLLMENKRSQLTKELDRDSFAFYYEWYHAAIRELVRLPDFKPLPEWIAGKLSPTIRPHQAKKSFELLLRLGLISWDSIHQKYIQRDLSIRSPKGSGEGILYQAHQNALELASTSLSKIPKEKRDFVATTICVDHEGLDRIKEALNKLNRLIMEVDASCKTGDHVIQINTQLFPLSKDS